MISMRSWYPPLSESLNKGAGNLAASECSRGAAHRHLAQGVAIRAHPWCSARDIREGYELAWHDAGRPLPLLTTVAIATRFQTLTQTQAIHRLSREVVMKIPRRKFLHLVAGGAALPAGWRRQFRRSPSLKSSPIAKPILASSISHRRASAPPITCRASCSRP